MIFSHAQTLHARNVVGMNSVIKSAIAVCLYGPIKGLGGGGLLIQVGMTLSEAGDGCAKFMGACDTFILSDGKAPCPLVSSL